MPSKTKSCCKAQRDISMVIHSAWTTVVVSMGTDRSELPVNMSELFVRYKSC